MGMKGYWVLAIVLAFVAGSLVTGAAVFADPDDDDDNLIVDALNNIANAINGIEPEVQDIVKRQFIQTIVSENGLIQVNRLGGPILYYGDTLCEIESVNQGTGVVIHFAMETTVQHLTDCVNNVSGQLFKLEGNVDATFQPGDLLAVEINTDSPAKIVEVHREQTT